MAEVVPTAAALSVVVVDARDEVAQEERQREGVGRLSKNDFGGVDPR